MKNGLTCECGNPKERGAEACGRCMGIEANLWHWLPFSDRPGLNGHSGHSLFTESEQGAQAFESRLNGLTRRAIRVGLKIYHLTCASCGKEFTAKRRHAKVCGDYCRAKRSRLAAACAA